MDHLLVAVAGWPITTLRMVLSRDFKWWLVTEDKSFKGVESKYVQVLVWSAVTFQLGVLGATAVLFLASTVMAGGLNAVRVPITSVAAVILMNDPMSGFKIRSLVLTFWGFSSYIYGSSSSSSSTQTSSVSIPWSRICKSLFVWLWSNTDSCNIWLYCSLSCKLLGVTTNWSPYLNLNRRDWEIWSELLYKNIRTWLKSLVLWGLDMNWTEIRIRIWKYPKWVKYVDVFEC